MKWMSDNMALERLRYLKNHEVNMRGFIERILKYMLDLMTEAGLKEELQDQMSEIILINQNKYIDEQSIQMPQNRKSMTTISNGDRNYYGGRLI